MSNIGPNINSGNAYQPPARQGGTVQQPGSLLQSGSAQQGQPFGEALASQQMRQLGELLLAPLMAYQSHMSRQELQLFMRNLLQLPQEIQQLFFQLATGQHGASTKQLLQLLAQNPKLSLEELQVLLKEALSGGEGKLMKLLQSANVHQSGDSRMMGEMMAALGKLGVQVASSPTEALATAMLMYIPWYPLAEQRRLNLYFEQPQPGKGDGKETGEGETAEAASEDAHLVMVLSTVYLGTFRVVVGSLPQNTLWVQLKHDAPATKVLGDIRSLLENRLTENELPPPVFEASMRGASPYPAPASADKAHTGEPLFPKEDTIRNNSLSVHAVGKVPLLVIHGGYLLARIVFELDAAQDASSKPA